jgi:hypothetical protein
VAGLNGFTNGQGGVTITVGPPATPPNPTNASYIEVDIAQAVPTTFLSVLGYKTINVSVRAVAGTTNGPSCIYALDPSASGALSLTGNFSVNASCGVIVDSSSSAALQAVGNGTVKTNSIGVAGNYSAIGNVTLTPTPHINVAPVPDPLASIAPPTVTSCTQQSVSNIGPDSISGIHPTLNFTPVVYSGGISISAIVTTLNFAAGTYGNGISFSGIVTTANFNPGQYQNGGGGGASITL